jgi:hypothetical protein
MHFDCRKRSSSAYLDLSDGGDAFKPIAPAEAQQAHANRVEESTRGRARGVKDNSVPVLPDPFTNKRRVFLPHCTG